MELSFGGEIWYWRGPAPFHFVTVPPEESELIGSMATAVTYGWGMIPVRLWVGTTEVTTSLWPKNGGYIVPITAAVRRSEDIDVGDEVRLRLRVGG